MQKPNVEKKQPPSSSGSSNSCRKKLLVRAEESDTAPLPKMPSTVSGRCSSAAGQQFLSSDENTESSLEVDWTFAQNSHRNDKVLTKNYRCSYQGPGFVVHGSEIPLDPLLHFSLSSPSPEKLRLLTEPPSSDCPCPGCARGLLESRHQSMKCRNFSVATSMFRRQATEPRSDDQTFEPTPVLAKTARQPVVVLHQVHSHEVEKPVLQTATPAVRRLQSYNTVSAGSDIAHQPAECCDAAHQPVQWWDIKQQTTQSHNAPQQAAQCCCHSAIYPQTCSELSRSDYRLRCYDGNRAPSSMDVAGVCERVARAHPLDGWRRNMPIQYHDYCNDAAAGLSDRGGLSVCQKAPRCQNQTARQSQMCRDNVRAASMQPPVTRATGHPMTSQPAFDAPSSCRNLRCHSPGYDLYCYCMAPKSGEGSQPPHGSNASMFFSAHSLTGHPSTGGCCHLHPMESCSNVHPMSVAHFTLDHRNDVGRCSERNTCFDVCNDQMLSSHVCTDSRIIRFGSTEHIPARGLTGLYGSYERIQTENWNGENVLDGIDQTELECESVSVEEQKDNFEASNHSCSLPECQLKPPPPYSVVHSFPAGDDEIQFIPGSVEAEDWLPSGMTECEDRRSQMPMTSEFGSSNKLNGYGADKVLPMDWRTQFTGIHHQHPADLIDYSSDARSNTAEQKLQPIAVEHNSQANPDDRKQAGQKDSRIRYSPPQAFKV